MTYKVDSVAFGIEPTSGQWLDRDSHGEDGWGHPVYVAPREFEMQWNLSTPTGCSQLLAFFNAIGSTGTSVVELPRYASPTYEFFAYTGCVIQEPRFGKYFSQYYLDCSLLITNIHT
jgi:hypothetical protein